VNSGCGERCRKRRDEIPSGVAARTLEPQASVKGQLREARQAYVKDEGRQANEDQSPEERQAKVLLWTANLNPPSPDLVKML
jgi:hypothetical protein